MAEVAVSQQDRYARHRLLNGIGSAGQAKIAAARVLLVGVGGLGSPAALYLAAAGVGHIVLADGDTVDLSNLQRQILHTTGRIGQLKAVSGQIALAQINPEIIVETITERLCGPRLDDAVANADITLACCDNFATREELNRACRKHRKPLVNAAVNGFDGQLAVFDFRLADTPCHHCLFPQASDDDGAADTGVFAPLVGVIGAMQAAETLKLIVGIGPPPAGRLLIFDALRLAWRSLKFGKDPDCPVCAAHDFRVREKQTDALPENIRRLPL